MIFKAIKMLFVVVLGAIYLPLNMLLLKVSPLFQKAWHEKDWLDLAFLAPVLFILWPITAVFSYPYELLVESAH